MTRKKKLGRPPLPKGQAKGVFSLRLSDNERAAIEDAARKAGQKPTEWARNTLLGDTERSTA